jgi:hypothetical protein
MPRGLAITLVTGLAVFGMWRGLAGKTRAADPENAVASAPKSAMTAEEWRYFNSQASHWRQCMLKK